jgi:hypothetical protein
VRDRPTLCAVVSGAMSTSFIMDLCTRALRDELQPSTEKKLMLRAALLANHCGDPRSCSTSGRTGERSCTTAHAASRLLPLAYSGGLIDVRVKCECVRGGRRGACFHSHILHFLPPHHSPCIALTRGLHAETPIQNPLNTRVGRRCCHLSQICFTCPRSARLHLLMLIRNLSRTFLLCMPFP